MGRDCSKCYTELTYSEAINGHKYCYKCCDRNSSLNEVNHEIAQDIFCGKICPFCFKILTKRYEGLVCKNRGCILYHKLETGWVLMGKNRSENNIIINELFSRDNVSIKIKWAKKKKEILRRDDYTCSMCGYVYNNFNPEKILHVHHIVPVSEEMALFLDSENLITLCNSCHNKIHSEDKYKFGEKQ